MSQPAVIALNNSHLLRAALTLAVLGVLGPGLFQLKPPQWFGAPSASDAAIPLAPAAEVEVSADRVIVAESVPALTAAAPKVLEPASEPVPATDKVSPIVAVPTADSVTAQGQGTSMAESAAASQPETSVPAAAASPVAVDIAVKDARAEPERPAVAARRAKAATPPANIPANTPANTPANILGKAPAKTPAPVTTQMASVSPRPITTPTPRKRLTGPIMVPREFAKRIPEAHIGLPVKSQKESFVAMTLPLILAANEEIAQRRSAIKRVVESGNRASVERWAKLYQVQSEGRSLAEIEKQLLLRADFVPVSLALAQAAIESGWGTSRFARQGNALFGQWAWQKDAGLKPAQASNANAVVRSFPNLFGSVRAYMHNLNTHPRYAAFRARRHLLRGRSEADLGYQLSNFMDGYAEIGEAYVGKLKTLIRSNDFGRYETARLS